MNLLILVVEELDWRIRTMITLTVIIRVQVKINNLMLMVNSRIVEK